MASASGYIVDASVALKWLIEEEGSDAALSLRGADLAAPALLRIEVGNILRTLAARQDISPAQAREMFRFLQTAPVVIVDGDEALEQRALDLALELRHPIYDCLYLALAQRLNRTLVTADRRFLRALTDTPHSAGAISLDHLRGEQPLGESS